MSDLKGFNCKSCGAPYAPNSEKCEYCGTWFRSSPDSFFSETLLAQNRAKEATENVTNPDYRPLIWEQNGKVIPPEEDDLRFLSIGILLMVIVLGAAVFLTLLGLK